MMPEFISLVGDKEWVMVRIQDVIAASLDSSKTIKIGFRSGQIIEIEIAEPTKCVEVYQSLVEVLREDK